MNTNKDLNLVLNKSYEVLRENNKVIVQIIKKIEEIKSGIEIEHDALKKCFQEIIMMWYVRDKCKLIQLLIFCFV